MNAPTPGWNPDPTGRHEYRYWDGSTWTDDVSDGGVTAVDPVGGPAVPGGEPTTTMDPTQQYGPQTGGFGPQEPPAGGFGLQGPPPGGFGPQGPPPGGFGAPPGGYDPYGSGQMPPGPPRRSGPSTGLIVGLVAVAVAIIAGVAFLLTTGDDDDDDTTTEESTSTTEDTSSDTTDDTADTTDTTEAGTSDVFALEVGDCLSDESSMTGEVEEVPIVPCDQPHVSEVFYSYIIPGDELPDSSEIETIVDEQCLGNFESFVGLPYNDSVLVVTWLEPTSGSWDAGDRELLCIVQDPAGGVTGTLEGANR